jgi:hypothetical protein
MTDETPMRDEFPSVTAAALDYAKELVTLAVHGEDGALLDRATDYAENMKLTAARVMFHLATALGATWSPEEWQEHAARIAGGQTDD